MNEQHESTGEKGRPRFRSAYLKRMFDLWIERAKMHDHLFMIGVAIIIGILCGYAAVGLRMLIDWFHMLFWSHPDLELGQLLQTPKLRLLLIPALGGLAVGPIIHYFAREAKGHGVPEVMGAVAVEDGVIRPRVALAKALASALTIASGGSAGREGPIIQIGAAIGSAVGQVMHISRRRLRTFVGCGAAAGIAATFNAPIAGALFSVEVILGEFGVAHFSPIVISSVMATVVSRHHFGDAPVFTVPKYELASAFELLPFMLLGLFCGLVAYVFIKALYGLEDLMERQRVIPGPLQPLLGGLLLGVFGMLLPHVYGDGYSSINMALMNDMVWWMLAVLLLAKIVATSLTLGTGGSGGVFAPSLFMGAMAGGFIGKISGLLPGITTGEAGGYALVGMGGVVAGATHAPISAILIIFEITYDYDIILPLMTVCIISTVMSSRLSRESIYTMKLVRKGIDIFRGRSLDVLKTMRVSECLRTDFDAMPPGTPVKDVMDRMIESDRSQFYVTDEDRCLLGVIVLTQLRRVLVQRHGLEHVLLAEDVANEGVTVCEPSEGLSHALLKFEESGLTELPVVDSQQSRRLIGCLRYADVVAVYNQEIVKIDMAGGMAARMSSSHEMRMIKVADGFYMAEWCPPESLWGKTLIEARLPRDFAVRVMLVKKKSSDASGKEEIVPIIPGGDYIIHSSDTFLVCGRAEDLERIGLTAR